MGLVLFCCKSQLLCKTAADWFFFGSLFGHRLANRMLTKTLDYLDAFARFKEKESVEAVERLLSTQKNLQKFERAQLGMLILYVFLLA